MSEETKELEYAEAKGLPVSDEETTLPDNADEQNVTAAPEGEEPADNTAAEKSDADKKEVEELCKDIGKIKLCNVNTGKKGRFAIVTFTTSAEAKAAVDKLNNKEIEGKKN